MGRSTDSHSLAYIKRSIATPSRPHMARSALDRVVSIPEIWIIVFDCFDGDNVDEIDYASLASCSRVSHSWNSLAEMPLWRTLPSVIPLFKLLGPMTRGVDFSDEEPGEEESSKSDELEGGPWVGLLVHWWSHRTDLTGR